MVTSDKFLDMLQDDVNDIMERVVNLHNEATKMGMNKLQWAIYCNALKCVIDASYKTAIETEADEKMYEQMYSLVNEVFKKNCSQDSKEVRKKC